jgi:hypothetical protein
VIAFNPAEGWSRDVTEDIANAVLSKAQRERRSIAIAAQEFLVRTLGVDAQVFFGLDLPMRFPIRWEWHHAGKKQSSCRSECDPRQRFNQTDGR